METAIENKIKAFPLYDGKSGCDFHRVKLPFMYAAEYIDDSPYKNFLPERLREYFGKSELVMLNRNYPFGVEDMRYWQGRGVKFAVDLDDWVELPWYHPNYNQYKGSWAKMILDTIRAADVVTVTTDRLYRKVKEYNSNTHVIPNALPYGYGQFRPHPNPPERTDRNFNFIYTGQSSHLEDVRLLLPSVTKIKSLKGVSFSLAGYKQHPIWDKIEQVFKNLPNYKRIENEPLTKYMTVYDGADCSIVPLCLNDFNACKSNLKILEAAAKKIPIIVSNVPPYRDDEDAPVIWVDSPHDWYKKIKYMVDNRNYAEDMGANLHEWANTKYNLFKWNKVRFELYQQTVDGGK